MGKFVLALAVAFLLSLLLTPLIKKLALVVGAVDRPDRRKVHTKVMPRLGGLAIYLAFTATVVLFFPLNKVIAGLLLSGGIIVLVGIVDDLRGVSPRVKLAGQIGAALVLVAYGMDVKMLTNPLEIFYPMGLFAIPLGYFSIPVTIFWVIGITNAVNLIDGLDGLAAGVTIISAGTLAVVAWMEGQSMVVDVALVLAATTLGFLRYNFHPAKIFMGDSGSMFLGFTLAALAIQGLGKGATVISLVIPIVILGVPIMDTTFAILRRYLNKQPIFQADKEHLHHRLLAMGLTHRQTVLSIYGLNFVLSASAILLTVLTTAQGVMILIGLTLFILWGAERLGVVRQPVRVKSGSRGFHHGGK